MFMPQSQPHHSRSYGAPSTVRRRGDKENAGALPSKTPSRNALKQVAGPSTGRMLGKATIDRNVLAPKSDAPPPNDDIKPKRLFANVQPPASTTRPVKPRTVKTPAHAKTPAPYRDVEPEPQPTPLPSAQRMRRRSRNSLNRTPEHQWDQELSLDSIAEVELEPAIPPAIESDYELEYAPSPVKEVPYVPEWADSIPDPIETMTKLGNMRPMLFTAAPSPPKALQPVPMPTLDLCDDDEIEEPILRKAKPAPTALKPKPAVATKPASRTLGIRGPSGVARPGAPAARPTARAPTAARPAVLKPASGTASAPPLASKTASSTRSVATSKPASTVSRPAPLGAARSVTTTRPATTAPRTTSAPIKTGVRGVSSKTEARPTATRLAPATTVRKAAPATQVSKLSARPGVKPGTTTRPALASKTLGRTAATAPAKKSVPAAAQKPTAAAIPSSPIPEFADMEMNFGVLDLDFDELEPTVQTPPAVDFGSDLFDLPLPAAEPEQSAKLEEATPAPVDQSQLRAESSVEATEPALAQSADAQSIQQEAPVEAAEPALVEPTVPQSIQQEVPLETAEPTVTELSGQPASMEGAGQLPVDEPVAQPSEQSASVEATERIAEPAGAEEAISEEDFEAVDPALAPAVAPAVPSSNLAFDTIPEEMEQELDLDMSALDISEDMSIESI